MLTPRHTFKSVAEALVDGLESGEIVLSRVFTADAWELQLASREIREGQASSLIVAFGHAVASLCGPLSTPLEAMFALYATRADLEGKRILLTKLHADADLARETLLESLTERAEADALAESCARWLAVPLFNLREDATTLEETWKYLQGMEDYAKFQQSLRIFLKHHIWDLEEAGVPTREALARELSRLYSDVERFRGDLAPSGFPVERLSVHAPVASVLPTFMDICAGLPRSMLADVFKVLGKKNPSSTFIAEQAKMLEEIAKKGKRVKSLR